MQYRRKNTPNSSAIYTLFCETSFPILSFQLCQKLCDARFLTQPLELISLNLIDQS
jgi:hypothetical protein